MQFASTSAPVSISSAVTDSPPRAPPIKYTAPLGTRWAKEKAAAGGAAAFDLPTDPKSIGPWILGECVGKGASGRVKIAKHRRTGQLAAVKILPVAPLVSSRASLATQQTKSERQRLGIDREITMMKLMNHPNIMRIYDVYEGEKELFLVLEYVEGGELFDFLVNRGRLPANEALIYFRQIVYGLNYAHTFSIIHRDLKPENILIASLSPPLLKIADWGMAAFAPPSLQLETSCGSPHYASPEIVNGEKYEGNATDIWSCGVILYALLTGRLPFDDKNVRTLLSKVKCGKYEMPSWIDPMAKDLLSKMLVVDVKQRITIPEIMVHPWLTVMPVISFTDSAGRVHSLPPPPIPPSPTLLGRPIFFPVSRPVLENRALGTSPTPFNTNTSLHTQSLVHAPGSPGAQPDPELLASLHIIWGRHADPAGETILRELCAPAGEGVHAKAFYFLLGRYREERGRYRESSGDLGLETLKFDLGWELENAAAQGTGLKKYEVPRGSASAAAPQRGGAGSAGANAGTAPSYSSNLSAAPPPPGIALGKRTLAGDSMAHTLDTPPTHAPMTVTSNANDNAHPARHGLTYPVEPNAPPRAKLSMSSVGNTTVPRPLPPRRGMTYSTVEGRERGRTGENAPPPTSPIGFSQHLQTQAQRAKAAVMYTGVLSSSPPGVGGGGGANASSGSDPRAGRQPLSPILSPNPGHTSRMAMTSAGATQSALQAQNIQPDAGTIVSVGSLEPPLLREEPALRASHLVQSAVGAPGGTGGTAYSGGQASGQASVQTEGKGKGRADEDKENPCAEEKSWAHVGGDVDQLYGVGLGVGVAAGLTVGGGNREMGKDMVNVGAAMLELGKTKQEKEKKARPPPLELPSINHKRSAFSMLGSPIALSSPVHYYPHQPSGGNRILASPVVGEFKGWFSNLFNWKHWSTHGGLLYSADDMQRTRANVTRVLETLGVTLTSTLGETSPQDQTDVLFCRVDHPTVDRETGLALKVVRFRVEFRMPSEPAHQVLTAQSPDTDDGTGPGPYFLIAPPPTPSLLITPTSAMGSGSRPRPSLLGRASFSQAGTAHGSMGPVNARWEFPPGCMCAVALVHEKGSMSTFKTVWRRLKEECSSGLGADAGGAANGFFSPVMPGTPFVDSQRMLM